MIALCQRLVAHPAFNRFIMLVIALAGVVVGMQTYDHPDWMPVLRVLDKLILGIFLAEVFVRMTAESPRPLRYFSDGWNVFDFTIVAISLISLLFPGFNGAFVAVFRLARVLRVFRIVRTIPKLQLLVNVLLKSIPSIGHVGLLLAVIFYIYGVMGVFLFRVNDPLHFGTLEMSLVSLFRVVTLEDWTDLMYINFFGCNHPIWGYSAEEGCISPSASGWVSMLYFISFVIVGTMVVLNLFIGVIMNSMEEAKLDAQHQFEVAAEARDEISAEDELRLMSIKLKALQQEVEAIVHRLSQQK